MHNFVCCNKVQDSGEGTRFDLVLSLLAVRRVEELNWAVGCLVVWVGMSMSFTPVSSKVCQRIGDTNVSFRAKHSMSSRSYDLDDGESCRGAGACKATSGDSTSADGSLIGRGRRGCCACLDPRTITGASAESIVEHGPSLMVEL